MDFLSAAVGCRPNGFRFLFQSAWIIRGAPLARARQRSCAPLAFFASCSCICDARQVWVASWCTIYIVREPECRARRHNLSSQTGRTWAILYRASWIPFGLCAFGCGDVARLFVQCRHLCGLEFKMCNKEKSPYVYITFTYQKIYSNTALACFKVLRGGGFTEEYVWTRIYCMIVSQLISKYRFLDCFVIGESHLYGNIEPL